MVLVKQGFQTAGSTTSFNSLGNYNHTDPKRGTQTMGVVQRLLVNLFNRYPLGP